MFCIQCGSKAPYGAKFCGSCGRNLGQDSEPTLHGTPGQIPPLSTPVLASGATSPNQRTQHAGPPYSSYDQVVFYRKQWFFWLMYFTISPIAIGILLFGDVYYPSKGHVKSFGLANRIVAGIIAIVILWRVFSAFT